MIEGWNHANDCLATVLAMFTGAMIVLSASGLIAFGIWRAARRERQRQYDEYLSKRQAR